MKRVYTIVKAIVWNFIIKIPLLILWRLFCMPGAAIISLRYFFPSEWGKDRNVATSARHYKKIETMAPFYSILFFIGIIVLFS